MFSYISAEFTVTRVLHHKLQYIYRYKLFTFIAENKNKSSLK